MKLAAVGEVSVDVYDELGIATLGGCSCNLARAAAASGASVSLFAPVGDDAHGRAVIDLLPRTGLRTHLRVVSGATAVQHLRISADGERQFGPWAPGVVASYRLDDAELDQLRTMDVIALADVPARAQCLALAGPRLVADFSQDAGTPWDFARLDVAFVGGAPRDLDRLCAMSGTALVVLTAGAAGAWAIERGRVVHQPSLATKVVDTTGCGDTFQGAFIAAYFGGADLETSLAAGARAAAVVAASIGGSSPAIRVDRGVV